MPSQQFPRKIEMSFASFDHIKTSCLIDANPRKIYIKSKEKYKFKCNLCNFVFEMQINQVVDGKWCSCINLNESDIIKFSNISTQDLQSGV